MGSTAVMAIFSVIKTATDLLSDDAVYNALLDSDELSDEDKKSIRDMRKQLKSEWDDLAPRG